MVNKVSSNMGKAFFINALIGGIMGVVICMIMLFLVAAVMVLADLSSDLASPLSSVCAAVGAMVGGYFTSRKNKSRGIINGLLVAGIMFLIISVVGGFVSDTVSAMSLIRMAVIILSALIGAIFGVNKSSKVKIV